MDVRPHRKIVRKKTREIKVGNISVGGKSIISVNMAVNRFLQGFTRSY